MRYRTLGKTGLEVSELGYGAWGIGGDAWIGADDDESLRALRLAIELGVNFLDTAYAYGLEAIDVQQLHVWSDEWLGQGDWLEAVERLKRDGKIRFFGVSINNHQPENAIGLVESGIVDTVQVIYNVFDQSPEDALFPAVEAAQVGVIARVPFDEGGLTGSVRPDTTFPEDDFRNSYFAGERTREVVWERVQAIARDLDVEVDQLAEIALRFCLSHPATSVVIPGMRSTRNVERNVRAAAGGPLGRTQLTALRRHRWVVDL
jgi:aryl-alcohol dehydrogenase-like predicted oxidoreductase